MKNISNQNKGAIGEYIVLSRLLLLGHDAAIANFTVNNVNGYDIFCRNNKIGMIRTIQVKTTTGGAFHVGMSHAPFFDKEGKVDMAQGRRFVESKIDSPWIFVDVSGTELQPVFRFFILSRKQIIDLILASEEWYLTGYQRNKHLSKNGNILIPHPWLEGVGVKASSKHIEFVNPLASVQLEDEWDNVWKD